MNLLPSKICTQGVLCLSFLWIVSPTIEVQLVGQQHYNTQRIVLANGDRLPVKLSEYQEEQLEFGSPLFQETVILEQKHVKAIQFESRGETPDESKSINAFALRLRNGSQLTGQILELDEERCNLDSFAVGKVEIPVEDLLEIRQWNADNKAQEVKRVTAANWYELGEEFRLDTQGWISLGRKSTASLEETFQANTRAEMEFHVDNNTSFQWLIKLDGSTTHSISIAKGSIVVESGDELSFGEFPVEKNLGYVAIDLRPTQLQILDVFGQVLLSIPQPAFNSASLEFTSETGQLKIREFTIKNSETVASTVQNQTSDRHLTVDGEPSALSFEQVSFSEGRFVVVNDDDKVQKFESAKLRRVWFGVSDDSAAKDKSDFIMIWDNGDQLRADQVEFQDMALSIVEGELGLEDTVINSAPSIVCFENGEANGSTKWSRSRDAKSFGLFIGGVPFSGEYSWGDDENPIRWKFQGFSDPVSLNVSRKIEIRRKKASSETPKLEEDRLLFQDGAIIPCKVVTVDDAEVRLKSSVTQTDTVEVSQVKGIFFRHRRISGALKRLTKESINRALRIPRFADEAEYTHILLAENGDLLRGRLVRLDEDHIIFESNLQKVKIARSKVLAIVALDSLSEESENQADEQLQTEQPLPLTEAVAQTTVQIDCGNSFKAVGKYVSLDSNSAILESPMLGRLEVEESQILQIAFNSPLNDVSVLDSFTQWNFGTAIEPRWTEDVPVAPEANLLMGQPAPDFELAVLDGKKRELFRLSDHLGKVIVVDFWATHSTPCELAMPGYLDVVNQFSADEVAFVAINQSEPATRVSRFVRSKNWKGGKFLLDSENTVGPTYAVSAIPHLTIIDKQGKIQFIKVGYSPKAAEQVREKIESLLK